MDLCDWTANNGWIIDRHVKGFKTSGKLSFVFCNYQIRGVPNITLKLAVKCLGPDACVLMD